MSGMQDKEIKGKIGGLIILGSGIVILFVASVIDLIGFGYPGFGTIQKVGVLTGAIIALVGIIFVQKRRKLKWFIKKIAGYSQLLFLALFVIRVSQKAISPFLSKYFWIRVRYIIFVAIIILWIGTGDGMRRGRGVIGAWRFILENPSLSYDEKMRMNWGIFYTFLKFVVDNTPSTAVVMRPPSDSPWLSVGNEPLIQYFLYPRKLVSGKWERISSEEKITHVMVAWGTWGVKDRRRYGWPKFPVNVRKFIHLPRKREVFVDNLCIYSSPQRSLKLISRDSNSSSQLLKNYLFDAEKEVNEHQLIELDSHLVEYFGLTYTFSNYDYWMKSVDIPFLRNTAVKARVKADTVHSVNLVAEVRYDNGKLSIFGSLPNKNKEEWEVLSIKDLYERAKNYALSRNWNAKKMEITKIGINPGLPLKIPYLERYGVIELERGQPGIDFNTEVENAPFFIKKGNFYRAKNRIEEAIKNYQLAEMLNFQDAWVHHSLGDMYRIKGKYEKAIKEYKEAIQLEPDITWFYFALGKVYLQQNKTDLARENFEKSVEVNPWGGWAQNALEEINERSKEKSPYPKEKESDEN